MAGPSAMAVPQYNKGAQITIDHAHTSASAVGKRFLNFCPTSDPDATPNTPDNAASKPTMTEVLQEKTTLLHCQLFAKFCTNLPAVRYGNTLSRGQT